jgi:hypothetical protein
MKGQIVPGDPGHMLAFETEDGEKHAITNVTAASMERRMGHGYHYPLGFMQDGPPLGWRITADFEVSEYRLNDHDTEQYDFDAEAEEIVDPHELPGSLPALPESTDGVGWPD